jgi:phosphoserine phosphatase RsbU/P
MSRNKILVTFFLVLIVSVILIVLLYKDYHPLGGINLSINASQAKEQGLLFLQDLGIEHKSLTPSAELKSDNPLINYLQKEFGSPGANKIMGEGIPGYYWNIDFKGEGVITIGGSGGRNVTEDEKLNVKFNTKGRLIGFTMRINDSTEYAKISKETAEEIASGFLTRYAEGDNFIPDSSVHKKIDTVRSLSFSLGGSGNVRFKNEKRVERENRTDFEFYYLGRDSLSGMDLQVVVTVTGNIISAYKTEYLFKDPEEKSDIMNIYDVATDILFFVVVFILILFVGFKRIRAFEIGFRTSIIMGVITALCFAIEIYLTIGDTMGWELLIPLILGPLLYGVGVMLIWAVGETITREIWNEKFVSIDLLTKGYTLHSRVGSSILTGISTGAALTAALLLLLTLTEFVLPVRFAPGQNTFLTYFNSSVPGLLILNHFLYVSIFLTAVYFLFIIAGIRRRTSVILFLILTSVLWGLINAKNIEPLLIAILIEIILGFIIVWVYYKSDLLAVLVALSTGSIILNGTILFLQEESTYPVSGYFIAAVFIILIILAVIALFTKDTIKDFQNITPVFVKHITERQRLQRELEIARDVQMSFLPGQNPDFAGLEVASRCIPALEVGGDYYDFISLDGNKGGIVVGDVSGKGTQAAFYMTLTKGFLKAVSTLSDSPSEVLSRMNQLFYENVERGTFISMIYGIFDMDKKTFRLARAGHNPVIVKTSGTGSAEMINPTGLALGLEKGPIFRRTIKEIEVPVSAGEVYVFYTDGFTEAMNKSREEYGEERLTACIEKYSYLSSEEILNSVFNDVKGFIGKTSQHDDMTMVVVKIK